MKPADIQVGKTYSNKTGSRSRTVVAIERAQKGCSGFDVSYIANDGDAGVVFLSSFAAWAKNEAPETRQ